MEAPEQCVKSVQSYVVGIVSVSLLLTLNKFPIYILTSFLQIHSYKVIKCALSGLRQFWTNESPLRMMKNAFYFTLIQILPMSTKVVYQKNMKFGQHYGY